VSQKRLYTSDSARSMLVRAGAERLVDPMPGFARGETMPRRGRRQHATSRRVAHCPGRRGRRWLGPVREDVPSGTIWHSRSLNTPEMRSLLIWLRALPGSNAPLPSLRRRRRRRSDHA